MRAAVFLVLCLICLALTAQAAPASAKDALQEQMLKRRDSKKEKTRSEREHHRRRRHESYSLERKRPTQIVADRLHVREVPAEEARNAERAVSGLLPQEELVTDLKAKVSGIEQARRDKARQRLQEIQVVDSIHMAKYGKAPPKFPAITRVGSAIGLTAAVMNVVNFIFSAKTTALATDQFSAPPTPPTLIDTAARWDGSQYLLLPVPEDKPDDGQSQKQKRDKLQDPVQYFHKRIVRRTTASSRTAGKNEGEGQHGRLSKRWIVSSIVGAGLGAALAPGFTSTIRNKEEYVDKPPFDPYDPNVLKPKDSFSAAAALPDQPLPAVPPAIPLAKAAASTPPNVDSIVFPVDATTAPATAQTRAQAALDFSSGQTQAVLRKRAVHNVHSNSGTSSSLDKRFFFSGGPWSKFAGAVTVGSIIPLLAEGVSHARWRQTNPRDRDILKELDDTPTYGAVGVPGHQPGQLATNAMPGYGTYVTQLERQQAKKQAATQTATQPTQGGASRLFADAAPADAAAVTAPDYSAGGQDNDPVLRRRAMARLEKRNKWLAGGSLALFGALLGYAQSATQFPTDRDEEKDKKKREAQKKQQELMAKQQQMQEGGGELAADPNAAAGAPSQADLLASIPVRPLPGRNDGVTGGYLPASGDGVGSGFASPSSGGAFTPAGSAGGQFQEGTSSLSDSLNAAAGYQTSGNNSGGGSVLRKRDVTSDKPHGHDDASAPSLSKRNPGIGTALSIGGTAMFLGTLAGNIYVGDKEKKKPVPLVTPNANTRGPMIPGGDLYTEYLESQRGMPGGGADAAGQNAIGGVGSGLATGAPANVKYGAAAAPANFAGGSELASSATNGGVWRGGGSDGSLSGSSWGQTSDGSSDDAPTTPVLKKRAMLKKRTPLLFPEAAIAETEGIAAAEAGAGALSRLGQGAAAASEAEAGTASLVRNGAGEGGATRAAYAGRGTGVNGEASLRQGTGVASEGNGMVRGTWMGMGSRTGSAARIFRSNPQAWGSARPAMAGEATAVEAGTPATVEGATTGGDAAAAAGKEEEGKGWSVAKAMGVIGGGAGATMTFNGIG